MRSLRKWLGSALTKLGQRLAQAPKDAREQIQSRIDNLQKFWFLADAPLFIDRMLVDQMYDAIFQPEFEEASRTKNSSNANARALADEVSGGGEVGVPTMFKFNATLKVSDSTTTTDTTGETVTLNSVHSSERKLEKLFNLYAYSYPDRCLRVPTELTELVDQNGKSRPWEEVDEFLRNSPGVRPLVVFDLGPKTRLLPMFAELTTSAAVPLYEQFLAAIPNGNSVPPFPNMGTPEYEAKAPQYWAAFVRVFDSTKAMQVVERAGKGEGRIEWIDYRLVGVKEDSSPVAIHLHISPRGQYPSGTFAYQFIRRGEHHGVRIVGTLKKGYDVNVLAIYER
jgi:hypothetical protein